MSKEIDDISEYILKVFNNVKLVDSDLIPNIDLYMDQVTNFLEKQLASQKRMPDDKVMTKTMINNYAKNDLLPSPVKKKYNKEHILLLIFIYYFKNILSINDIQLLFEPLTKKYFGNDDSFSLKDIYEEVIKLNNNQEEMLKEDVINKFKIIADAFEKKNIAFTDELSDDERDFLIFFGYICSLLFDIYSKKRLVEKLMDQYSEKLTVSGNGKEKSRERVKEKSKTKERAKTNKEAK